MGSARRFRILLPAAECLLAALFGGVGLWQRFAILSRPWFSEGQTMWNTTARLHHLQKGQLAGTPLASGGRNCPSPC